MQKKRYVVIVLLLFAIVVILTAGVYLKKIWENFDISFKEINVTAGSGDASQDNYLLFCEDNGWRNFPFLMGGRLCMLLLPNGEKYVVADQKGFLRGIADPVIQGSRVYWFEAWDGSSQGVLHATDIKNKGKTYHLPESLQSDQFVVSDEAIFSFRKTDEEQGQGVVVRKDLQTGEEESILSGEISYLTLVDEWLYCFDDKKNVLIQKSLENGVQQSFSLGLPPGESISGVKSCGDDSLLIQTDKQGIIRYNMRNGESEPIVDNGNFEDSVMSYGTMKLKAGRLYYYNEEGNIYAADLKGKKQRLIIDWEKTEFMEKGGAGNELAGVKITWCRDYIAAQISRYNANKDIYTSGIAAFDYDGKQIYLERNDNLSF